MNAPTSIDRDTNQVRGTPSVRRAGPPSAEALEGRLFLSVSDPDIGFGSAGRAVASTPAGAAFAAVAAAAGGKYVAVGSGNQATSSHDFLVSRFNADGTPDATFGGGTGRAFTDFGALDYATGVAVLAGGKILVAGTGANTDGRTSLFCVARYNANGTLDSTFGGGDGKVTTSFGGRFAFTGGLKVLSSGKFLVAGTNFTDAARGDFALARYNANGTLDTTFGGGDGKVTADFGGTAAGPGNQQGNAVAVNAAGQIFVAGTIRVGFGKPDVGVARFTPGGVLDGGFGGGKGWVKTDLTSPSNPAASDEGNAVVVTPAGKILVVGWSAADNDRPGRFALVQYNANGTLDTGFGGTGKVLTNLNPDPLSNAKPASHLNPAFIGQAVAVTAAGKIVVAGYGSGTSYDPERGIIVGETHCVGLARYNADGTFGVGGKKPSTILDGANAVLVDPAGKVVVAGTLGTKAALARFGTPAAATASIGGTFFNDKNGDGVRQPATEPLLADWQAYVDSNNNGVYDYGEPTAFTNGSGSYTIKGLTAGKYRVREVRKDGWSRTRPGGGWPLGYYGVTLAAGAAATGKSFGNRFAG